MTNNAKTAITSFADRYPFESFFAISHLAWWRTNDFSCKQTMTEELQAQHKIAMNQDQADKVQLDEHRTKFMGLIYDHLVELRSAGLLKKIENVEGRKTNFSDGWNAFVSGKPDNYKTKWMAQSIAELFTPIFVRMDSTRRSSRNKDDSALGVHTAPTEGMARAAWQKICNLLDEGTSEIDLMDALVVEQTDAKSGSRGKFFFENWKPTFMIFDTNYNYVPAKNLKPIQLVSAEFTVPTGKLMFTDALRLESFTDGTEFKPERDYGELSLNSSMGQSKRITAHAEDHNIAFTQTTNTCVAIHLHEETGRLIVTERWMGEEFPEDENGTILEGWKSVGNFSCDVWAMYAFDRQTAIDLMKSGGSENAEKELDDYLSSKDDYSDNIAHVDVEPGTWILHSGDNFSKRINRKKHGLPKGVKIWCMLEKKA